MKHRFKAVIHSVTVMYDGMIILFFFYQVTVYFDYNHGKVVFHAGKQLSDCHVFGIKGCFSVVEGDGHFRVVYYITDMALASIGFCLNFG
jgi:hypothetical protein